MAKKAAIEKTDIDFETLTDCFSVGRIQNVIRSGSRAQPFKLFLPDDDDARTRAVLDLLQNRRVAHDEYFPRRTDAHVTGALKLFGGEPERRRPKLTKCPTTRRA